MKVNTIDESARPSPLKIANLKLLDGNYREAIIGYVEAILVNPTLAKIFEFNLRLAQSRFQSNSKGCIASRVMVVNLGAAVAKERHILWLNAYHNIINDSTKIAHLSAEYDQKFLSELKNKGYQCAAIETQDSDVFFRSAVNYVLAHPCNVVHLACPEFPDVVFGLLYKWIWGAYVAVDVSNGQLLQQLAGIKLDIKAFLISQEKAEGLGNLNSNDWTFIGLSALGHFDVITCAGIEFQRRFGSASVVETEAHIGVSAAVHLANDKNITFISLQHDPILAMIVRACSFFNKVDKTQKRPASLVSILPNQMVGSDGSEINFKDVDLIRSSGLFDEKWYAEKYLKNADCQDAILHYLTIGCSSGFDPSLNFSSEFYLRRYKSVAKSKINPLLHYIKHGKKNGYLPKTKNNFEPEGEFATVDIYLSCWLRNRESIHDGVLNLYKILRKKGARVKFVTHSEPILEFKDIDAYNVSFSLLDTPIYFNHNEFMIPDELAEELYSIIFFGKGASFSKTDQEIFQYLSQAYSFWRKEFLLNKPKLIIVWGSTCPISRLHIWLCKNLNIPYLVMERGHFSKTLGIDIQGQFAHGASLLLPERIVFDNEGYEEIAKWIRDNEEIPYAHKNVSKDIDHRILEAKKLSKPVFLFIGVNEPGSGIAYSSNDVVERHSAYYHTSYSALLDAHRAICSIFDDFVLVFKSHPSDRTDYSSLNLSGLIMEMESNINELIEISDVCISMSTTALARCIIEDKPILTMSYTDLSGLGIAYECVDKASLVQLIRDAYNKVDFEKRKEIGRSFICNLFNRKLFSIYPEGSVAQGLESLSERIVQRMDMHSLLDKARDSNDSGMELDACSYRKFKYSIDYEAVDIDSVKIDVIIPVYSDVELTRKTIELALTAVQDFQNVRILIVNDCSPEVGMAVMLKSFSHLSNVVILNNAKNLGFSGAVNLAISQSSDRDVVLLNSDAIVPADFLVKMVGAAYCNSKIATVTPFSNNAGIAFSIPVGGNSLDVSNAEAFVAEHNNIISCNRGLAVEVPTGHGFCMYIRRSVIRNIGYFDELTFGRGYSEEVDFCLRARSLGYVNIACVDLFVGHVGGVSFADEANDRKIRNRKIIAEKYNDYFDEIKFLKVNDPLKAYRVI